jgi:competence ComEA-like helix-hairpin-helix protein
MSKKIDINVADAETLATISGIGPALATRIIEYRETVHPFEEVIELAAVPGISEKMVRGFEGFVMVQPALAATAVPQNLEEPEEIILLPAPEPVELLPAPEPSAVASEEAADAESPAAAEPDPATRAEEAEPEPEVEARAATPETRPASAQISPIPQADPVQDLRATLSTPPAADWEANAQRRGCISTLLGATFGAILGAVLTLAILAAVNNGTINYDASDSQIQQQLNTEIISRTNELNQLSTRVSVVATAEAAANQSLQTDLAAANQAINEELANNEEIISYLATRSGDFEERLQDVAGAADTFTGFLDGLRLLLGDLEGGTATPTPAPAEETVSPTPTPFSTNTPISTPTTAVQPTRTAQPTATPFTFPTNTPAPQP